MVWLLLAMRVLSLLLILLLPLPLSGHTGNLGELSANLFNLDSTSNTSELEGSSSRSG